MVRNGLVLHGFIRPIIQALVNVFQFQKSSPFEVWDASQCPVPLCKRTDYERL
jgi:hypothetical protein